ncbi:DegT/DnrJ/EryC1/StrS family aminotransferase [Terriglobus tenax]|uniref:DegT/DnrJ/EryC1/StrS family aminotransferase n=1 Tax=Terriglobus tenax TaxID=1111115 RepID=UPI0021E0B23B|nr:DegT/DnrJ/EryC1/StrS family aminotransferase [Terriglobus tenax]
MPNAVPLLDFSREYRVHREEILAALELVADSQKFILGPEVDRFEAAAAEALQAKYAIGCASGTDALWLALAAAGVGPGDEVITTPFSFFASTSAILRAGATPVFADIDPVTFNLSAAAAEAAITPGTRAVLPVHLYGQPVDWDHLQQVADRHKLLLVEDAAQAWGARWKDTPAGALGISAAFSFYPTKNLAAMGDAGLVSTNDPAVADRARALRTHGMRKRYFHDEVGWNARLDSFQAAVLNVRLKYVNEGNAERAQIAENYLHLFQQADLIGTVTLPETLSHAHSAWHQYVIRAPRRDDLRAHLTNHQIGTEIYYPLPIHLQPALEYLGYKHGSLPHTEQAAHEVLALPIFPGLRLEEQELVVQRIAEFYR